MVMRFFRCENWTGGGPPDLPGLLGVVIRLIVFALFVKFSNILS